MGPLARQLAQSFLNAAVWRVAWNLPLGLLLVIAAIIFVALAVLT
jgi:hypothetical protein